MRIDDQQVLNVIEQLEAAAATMRRLAGFPELHAPSSRREGTETISIRNAAILVKREWNSYPSKTDLMLELQDRGLTVQQATNLIEHERETREAAAR